MSQSLPSDDDPGEATVKRNRGETAEKSQETIVDTSQDDARMHEGTDPEATLECDHTASSNASRDPEQTVDDQRGALQSADPDQTIDDPDPDITIDDPDPEMTVGVPDPEMIIADAPASGHDVHHTAASDVERTIDQQWGASLADNTAPQMTIKGEPEPTKTRRFDFSLKTREVSREGAVDVENPDYVQEKKLGEGGMGRFMPRGRIRSIATWRSRF